MSKSIQNLTDDIRTTSIKRHASSIAMTLGILSMGVALGVKWAAVTVLNELLAEKATLLAQSLAPALNSMMYNTLVVGTVALLIGVYLATNE